MSAELGHDRTRIFGRGYRLVLILALATGLSMVAPTQAHHRDIVKSRHRFKGTFVSFEQGDYVHANFKGLDGTAKSLFISSAGLMYFLASHANQGGTFAYNVDNAYIEESGGRQTIEKLADATIDGLKFSKWWAATKKGKTPEEIEKMFQPMVDKLMDKPN